MSILWTENRPKPKKLMKAFFISAIITLIVSTTSAAGSRPEGNTEARALKLTAEQLVNKIEDSGLSRFVKEENNLMLSFVIDEYNQLQVRELKCSNPQLRQLLIENLHGMQVLGAEVIKEQLFRMPLHFSN